MAHRESMPVWALQEVGIQAIIAVSFADIFASNAAKNGLVLIHQPELIINTMLRCAYEDSYRLTITLLDQKIISSDGQICNFTLDPFRKYCFLNGFDDLDYLLRYFSIIEQHNNRERV